MLCRDDARVAWVTDYSRDRAAAVARSFGVQAFVLPSTLRDIPPVDVLLVAIPYGVRKPYYEALRGRPISLYVEKPFASTVQEHVQVASWFSQSQIGCGLQRRSSSAVKAFASVLKAGIFGAIRHVRLGHGSRGKLGGSSYSADLKLAGGGILMEAGIHLLDVALYALEAVAITAASGSQVREVGFDVHTEASLQIRTRELGAFPLDVVVSGLTDTIDGIEVEYEQAILFFSESDGALRVRSQQRTFSITSAESSNETSVQQCYAHWSAFLDSVRDGQPNHTAVSHCLLTTEAIERLYSMADQGS